MVESGFGRFIDCKKVIHKFYCGRHPSGEEKERAIRHKILKINRLKGKRQILIICKLDFDLVRFVSIQKKLGILMLDSQQIADFNATGYKKNTHRN